MAFEPAQHSFITLEGVDGAGKSTQARLLARVLDLAGYQVVTLREPGGTAISEKIRALLLDPANTAMGDTCELLLYEAARAQLVHEVIAPALAAGKVVLCDRFYDSTTCYQAFADGLDRQMVRDANNLAVAGTHPALTLVYHITPEQAALRMAARGAADRMEAKGMAFQERVYQGFCAIAAEEPPRKAHRRHRADRGRLRADSRAGSRVRPRCPAGCRRRRACPGGRVAWPPLRQACWPSSTPKSACAIF
ncbi:MAG: dTMP kinase [Collinsella sp.]